MAAFVNCVAELKRLTSSGDAAGLANLANSTDGWKAMPAFTQWLSEQASLTGKGNETKSATAALNGMKLSNIWVCY